MSRGLRLTVDTRSAKPTELIGQVACMGVPVVLTSRMLLDLSAELGGYEAATAWLIALATETDRPVAVNVETTDGNSTTVMIAPKSWTEAKLRGWTGGLHHEIEALFGPATIREWGTGN